MAPFSIPAPCVVPLRTPLFGGPRTIDTQTKIELVCGTYLAHEIFYTLDGTKPQPYAGIIQGSKLYKYKLPFCLPCGKIAIKAVALSSHIHSMRSNVVTKYFEVVKTESSVKKQDFMKAPRKKAPKKNRDIGDPGPSTEKNGCENGFLLNNSAGKNGTESLDNFPPDLDFFPGEDASESLSDSLPSASNRTEELLGVSFEIENTPSPPLTELEETSQEKNEISDAGDFKTEYIVQEADSNLKVEKKLPTSEVPPTFCLKCETILHPCCSCSTLNASTSQYCMQCGEKLMHKCCNCKELNYVLAVFCHYCGKKLDQKELQISNADHSVMAAPQKTHAAVQQTLCTASKQTQTLQEGSREAKRIPSRSPGRGYWHQQLDYICNHLKSYAYNNLEFRDSISEPILSDFQKAQVSRSDDVVSVTVTFSPFVREKEENKDINKNMKVICASRSLTEPCENLLP